MIADYRVVGSVAAALVVLLGGCAVPGTLDPSTRLTASSEPYQSDIPLPVGFALADQSSEDWATGTLRYVRHRYRGRGDCEAVRRFYREQMPLTRWAAVSEGCVQGRCVMRFEQGSESCVVRIEPRRSLLSRGVIVDVLITPKDRGARN